MRLEEIETGTAASQRVKQLRANAKTARDKAKQLMSQADASADQLAIQQSRKQASMATKAASTATIKPNT